MAGPLYPETKLKCCAVKLAEPRYFTMENPGNEVSAPQKQDRSSRIREWKSFWYVFRPSAWYVLCTLREFDTALGNGHWHPLKRVLFNCCVRLQSDFPLKIVFFQWNMMIFHRVPSKIWSLVLLSSKKLRSLSFPNQARRRRSPKFGQQPAAHHVTC